MLKSGSLQFYYAIHEDTWVEIEKPQDASILSDDYVRNGGVDYTLAFTGLFAGICCQDLSGGKCHADFDWFEYKKINPD